jgi:hypothetical protein
MELYLTYHKVLDKLQSFQENYCCLESFGYGNLVDFGKNVSGQTVTYPYLFVVPLSVSYDQNTTTYQLSVLFADRLNENLDNEKDAVSDMSLAARQLLSEIWRGNLQDFFDAPLPVNGQPFMERFNDYVAGIAIDLNLTVMEDINACEQWFVTPSPTPTFPPTPSITPTNSATPQVTPTNTATPTRTPQPTPTNTSTPSVTATPTASLPMPYNAFNVASGTTALDACNRLATGTTFVVYANIGGGPSQCSPCIPFNCFPCVSSNNDTWWLDAAFTIPLPDMWIANYIAPPSGNPQRQQIVNQQIVGGTFTAC